MLVASGRFRVSADTPDQVELFQGVARRVSDMLQRPVVSYANGREIVVTFGQEEAPALALRSPGWSFPGGCPVPGHARVSRLGQGSTRTIAACYVPRVCAGEAAFWVSTGSPVHDTGIFSVVSRRIRPAVARMVMASSIPRAAVAVSGIV